MTTTTLSLNQAKPMSEQRTSEECQLHSRPEPKRNSHLVGEAEEAKP
jgi:hypothetical protein